MSGFFTYSRLEHDCSGSYGNSVGGPMPDASLTDLAVARMRLTDVYTLHGEDVYYLSVPHPDALVDASSVDEHAPNPDSDIRLLLYQPQYRGTTRMWHPEDMDIRNRKDELYNRDYQCRVELRAEGHMQLSRVGTKCPRGH